MIPLALIYLAHHCLCYDGSLAKSTGSTTSEPMLLSQLLPSLLCPYPLTRMPDLAAIARCLIRELAPHKRPKRYVPIAWPRNAQGKINRQALATLAAAKGSAGL